MFGFKIWILKNQFGKCKDFNEVTKGKVFTLKVNREKTNIFFNANTHHDIQATI